MLKFSIIQKIYTTIYTWVHTHLFSLSALFHVILLGVSFLIAILSSFLIKKLINTVCLHQKHNKFWLFLSKHKHHIFPLCFLINCIMSENLAIHFKLQSPILNIASSLLGAWFIIKISHLFIANKFWQKPFEWIVWAIAVLSSLNLYDLAKNELKKISIDLGELNISLFDLIRASLSIGISLWIAIKISNYLTSKISNSKNITPATKVLFTKTTKFLLVLLAVIIAFQAIGISLNNFAFFTGAIGVGIGFGLQTIVSNLFAGVLLLLDKSVKPGDVIEIDNKIGWIKSLSARFVSIQTLEGKEILIPNEDLIKHKVVNWSFSTNLIRLDIDVGVAYDTNIDDALVILKNAAIKIDRVLKRPQTSVIVKNFGDSAIELQVWAWIADPEKGIENVKSDIRLQMWRALKQNNINIPFPQRDLHIIPNKKG